jgi:IclR family transcriptional regulator, acetate operon repressor
VAARRGDRYPLHASAVGKAVAAGLPEHRVRAILAAEGMPRLTRYTLTEVGAYLGEVANVRVLGYAVEDGEHDVDERSLATPLPHANLPAALAVSAPATRLPLDSVEDMARPLMETAAQLVQDLGGNP